MATWQDQTKDDPVDTSAEEKRLQNEFVNALNGGMTINQDLINNLSSMNLGRSLGKKEFSGDPEWQRMRAMKEDLAKGYSGQELGALRSQSRSELSGQRQKALQALRSNLSKGGVGGARGAAIEGSQELAQQKAASETERKMLLDEGQVKRQGVNDLQDFIMRQKMGEAGYTFGVAGLGSASQAAQAARQANSSSGKK
jgi:hypothetical protein